MNTINSLKNYRVILALALIFVVANIAAIALDNYFLSAFPFLLLIIYWAIFSIDRLVYLTVFFVPISLPLENYAPQLGFNLQLPTEPILGGVMILVLLRLIYERHFDWDIVKHPVSLAIFFNLAWMFFTSLTSTMPFISFKFLIARVCFLVSFYFLATQMFTNKQAMRRYVWAFIPLMIGVIFYAIAHLSQYGLFNQQAAHLSANPFFKDHTSYGAILAMLIPFAIGFALTPKYSAPFRILSWMLVAILCFALLLSYTRAAWLGILVALGVFLLFVIKIKIRTILIICGIVAVAFFSYQTEIILELKSNRQDSSKDLMKHVKSIANISTDVSNKERLNRWHSAFRMIAEKPILGWGPGTFMFQYAPYQLSSDKTIISTNRGDLGNAHSEYIGSFAESGLLGCLSLIAIMLLTIYTAFKIYIRTDNRLQIRILVLSASLGLVTYYTHGFLNNFLDTDKASALFWGYTAMIVALDIYHAKEKV